MKMLTKFIAALVAALALALALTLFGCANDNRGSQDGKLENGHSIVYAFTVEKEVKTADDGSMLDYMNALKDRGDLTFEGTSSDFGFYITSVLGVGGRTVSSTANSYSGWDWAVYTTVTTVDGVTYSGTQSFDFNGITFYRAAYGVSGIPCITGESYALVYEFSTMNW